MSRPAPVVGGDDLAEPRGDRQHLLERQPLGELFTAAGDRLDRVVGLERAESVEHVVDRRQRVAPPQEGRRGGGVEHRPAVSRQRCRCGLAHQIVDERQRAALLREQAGVHRGIETYGELWRRRAGQLRQQRDVDRPADESGDPDDLQLLGGQGEKCLRNGVAAASYLALRRHESEQRIAARSRGRSFDIGARHAPTAEQFPELIVRQATQRHDHRRQGLDGDRHRQPGRRQQPQPIRRGEEPGDEGV